jgi:hypothetical protein
MFDFDFDTEEEVKRQPDMPKPDNQGDERADNEPGYRCPRCGVKFKFDFPIDLHWAISADCAPDDWVWLDNRY